MSESINWYYPKLAEAEPMYAKNGFRVISEELIGKFPYVTPNDLVVGWAEEQPLDEHGLAHSVTELSDVPEEDQTAAKQGKGVGTRLYNNYEALSGTQENPEEIIAYAIPLSSSEILDLRRPNDYTNFSKGLRIIRHAFRIAEVKTFGLSHLTDRLHGSFGEASAVIQPQPPHADLRQAYRHLPGNPDAKPAFMLIRNPNLGMLPIGSIRRSR